MKNKTKILGVLTALFISSQAWSALAPDATRYIYKGDVASISAMVNNESDETYGAQVWVDNIVETDARPTFIVTPSFFKVDGNGRQVYRIMKVSDHVPQDKESIYWLNLQEIPQKHEGNGISMAIRTQVKLIYRPAALLKNRINAEKNLTVQYEPGKAWLTNTTPYIFAIGNVLDDKGKPIPFTQKDNDKLTMFMPGDRVDVTGHQVKSVFALNDYGNVENYELTQFKGK